MKFSSGIVLSTDSDTHWEHCKVSPPDMGDYCNGKEHVFHSHNALHSAERKLKGCFFRILGMLQIANQVR